MGTGGSTSWGLNRAAGPEILQLMPRMRKGQNWPPLGAGQQAPYNKGQPLPTPGLGPNHSPCSPEAVPWTLEPEWGSRSLHWPCDFTLGA